MVEAGSGLVEGEGGEDQFVVAESACFGDQGGEEGGADPGAACGAIDVDREVGDEAVGGSGVEGVERAPADDDSVPLGDQYGVALAFPGQPGGPLLGGPLLGFEGRQPVDDALVVDAGDGDGVVRRRRSQAQVGAIG
jgi:hypothetical protein